MPSYTIALNVSSTRARVTEWERDTDGTRYATRNMNVKYQEGMGEDEIIAAAKREWNKQK